MAGVAEPAASNRSAALRALLVCAGLVVARIEPGLACDMCQHPWLRSIEQPTAGVFTALDTQVSESGSWLRDGHEINNPQNEHLRSVIGQTVIGYRFDSRLSVQAAIPYIDRTYRRMQAGLITTGVERGWGDVSLTVERELIRHVAGETRMRWALVAGAELPTGSTERLSEELDEAGSARRQITTQAEASGLHGHDLAVGSGSFDGILGTAFELRCGRLAVDSSLEFVRRTKGDFNYRFADQWGLEFSASAAVLQSPNTMLWLGIATSGERKGMDRLGGERLADTDYQAIYFGPTVTVRWRSSISAQFKFEVPTLRSNHELQLVADRRIRLVAAARF